MSDLPYAQNQKFFSIADVADYFHISTKTVLRWIAAGHLSAFKLGRQWRIACEDLKIFANARKKHAIQDVLICHGLSRRREYTLMNFRFKSSNLSNRR